MNQKRKTSTKKQHYVPQMYLNNFAIDERCFVYNPFTKKIENNSIRNICEENYLYEIRNKEGVFLFPDSKNQLENALSQIEGQDAELIKSILSKVEKEEDYLILSNNEREGLIGFSLLMLLRNPLIRNVLPDVFKISTGIEISKKEEISFAWLFTILNIEKICPGLINSQISFLKTKQDDIFITSSFPLSFSGDTVQRDFYLPLSSQIAMELSMPDNLLINVNKCQVKNLNSQQTDFYNSKLLSRDVFLISVDEMTLIKYISFMDDFDNKKSINPYTMANLNRLEKMPSELFVIIVNKLIEEELKYKNKTVALVYNRLIKKGFSKEDAIKKIAYACADEVKKYVICNKRIDWQAISDLFKKL